MIEDVTVHALPDGLHGHAGIHRYETVSVRVLETLRGPRANRLQFVEDGDWGSHQLAELRRNKQEALLFLEPWSRSSRFRRASGGYAYTRFPYVARNVLILGPSAAMGLHARAGPLRSYDAANEFRSGARTVKNFLKNYDDHLPLRTAMTKLPPELCAGYYMVTFTATLQQRAAGQAGAIESRQISRSSISKSSRIDLLKKPRRTRSRPTCEIEVATLAYRRWN